MEKINKDLKTGMEMIYLSRNDCINSGLGKDDIISIVETALSEHGMKKTKMPAKSGISSYGDSFYHAMPAALPGKDAYGIKWIATFPGNSSNYGLPRTSGLIILNDVATGYPVAVMDAMWITAKRTAAVSLLSARHLAKRDFSSFGMFGCGVQGKEHVTLFLEDTKSIKEVYLYDIVPGNALKLAESLEKDIDAHIICADTPEQVVKESEVIASATVILNKPDPFIRDEWVQKGQTILICDLDSFWEIDTMRRADKFVVDDIGQHYYFGRNGYYPDGIPDIYAETGEIVAGLKTGRERDEELIVVNNSGMAVEDIMVASIIFEKALKNGVGRRLLL